MAIPQRPLSPHLQIYRRQITSVLSILHRITGVILAFGAFGLAGWLLAVSSARDPLGPHDVGFFMAYEVIVHYAGSPPGLFMIVAFSWCLIYHLLNGVRHLFWDAGKGFEIKQFYVSGWAVVVLSFVLTGGLWFLAMNQGGGAP